jgi:hypothetical protein
MRDLVSILTCGLVDQHPSSAGKRTTTTGHELRNQGNQDEQEGRHGRHLHLFHRRHRSSESSSNKSGHRPPVVPGSDYRISDQDLHRVDTDTTAPSQHTNLDPHHEPDPDAMNHPLTVDTTLSPGFGFGGAR